ncbi:superoxide dismutase [Cu-Zn]-like [Ostrinia nubilalis]|uniref:superoxide dismutase [Cu-Zn]-like n=1 Tax=Ostrinia furnacalis TaxID=93504 RepID=UPI00103C11C1|nr:superoxide dismutase [Cu-Zn]-like [Ostrinia furnacalis]
MLKLAVALVSVAIVAAHHDVDEKHSATVFLLGTDVHGTINFNEVEGGKVRVQGTITGMPAGEYGFHVHEKGDVSGGCATAGAHFNPEKVDHGHPNDKVRHVGDLGNVRFNEQGVADIDFVDSQISLRGAHSIIGRAVVLHEKADDFGRSDHPDSRKTGNAGGRVACGVIGIL